ncbi:hypothetical protein BS17DRAFT_692835 [Gyrodon lividus]|nr:hypothetical protein BS17DRAFT_692835 [Gyrodon lividus]
MSLVSGLNNTEMADYTGIRPRTMRVLPKRFRETGEIVKKPVVAGQPRLLNSLDAMFLQDLVERQPDMMLCEMQEYLCQICHIDASQATLTRTLHHQGFT